MGGVEEGRGGKSERAGAGRGKRKGEEGGYEGVEVVRQKASPALEGLVQGRKKRVKYQRTLGDTSVVGDTIVARVESEEAENARGDGERRGGATRGQTSGWHGNDRGGSPHATVEKGRTKPPKQGKGAPLKISSIRNPFGAQTIK